MKILGIETSCDETAVSLIDFKGSKIKILCNLVSSQIEIHQEYGGIVPEVAARKHTETIMPLLDKALGKTKPDLIAVTQGPGLITSLQVGLQTAKTLAYSWQIPLLPVNHLEAHLWSWLLNQEKMVKYQLPAIGLIVSGGHTELILIKGIGKYKLVGQTRDDAAGEAFDKVAKLMDLGYPGGPIISHLSQKGDSDKIKFPRPMIDSSDLDFSFSGLKTAVKYFLKEIVPTGNLSVQMTKDIAASFQKAAIEVLVNKTFKAAEKFKVKAIFLGGGVSANDQLIKALREKNQDFNLDLYLPDKKYTGDNGAMIALVGYLKNKEAKKKNWQKLTADPNLNF